MGITCLIAGNVLLVLAMSALAWSWLNRDPVVAVHLVGLGLTLLVGIMTVLTGYRAIAAPQTPPASRDAFDRFLDRTSIGVWEMDWSIIAGGAAGVAPKGIGSSGLRACQHIDQFGAVIKPILVNRAGQELAARLLPAENVGAAVLPLPFEDTVVSAAVRAFLAGNSSFEIEAELIEAGGAGVQLIVALSFPQPGSGHTSVVMSAVDISLYVTRDKAMKVAQGALAHASRLSTMGALTASVTDAFSQPLTAVLMSGKASLRWLRRDNADLAEVESSIEDTLWAATTAADIVRRTRTFMGPGGGALESINVAVLLNEVVQFLHREMAIGTIRFETSIDDDIPEVTGDRVQIQQVIINLMMNAIDALNEKADGERTLSLAARGHGEFEVLVCVADTAGGIKSSFLDRIFEPLFTTKTEAVGIGLTICRNTIDAHGGEIWVESEMGSGSSFKFTLPANGSN